MKFEAIIPIIEGIVSLGRNRLHFPKSYIFELAHGNGELATCLIHVLVFMLLHETIRVYSMYLAVSNSRKS